MSRGAPQSLGSVAIRGSVMNSAQWLLNKALTAGAMLLIAWFLTPEQYGTGTQALAISAFAFVLPVMTVGDVLIAHPRNMHGLARSGEALARRLAITSTILTLAITPIAIRLYPTYSPWWLGGLLVALSTRPLIEAWLMLPMTRLRLSMAYPKIAMVEGVVQTGATLGSVAIAALGGQAAALVAPQLAATAARSRWYRSTSPEAAGAPARPTRIRLLLHYYWRAASAQYLHNIIVGLEVLVLGMASGDVETGLFGLAFSIAVQANSVISYQLGQILQPIFGHLQSDPVRQIAGFLKAQAVLSAVCVPICLTQALLAEPLFRIAFAPKWQPAVPVFQVVSLTQAFYFATGPSMACLRAQRRFGTFLTWQAAQLIISVPVYWIGARHGGALGVALASGLMWATSSPLVVWLCTLASGRGRALESLMIFVRPWVVGLPIFGLAYSVVGEAARFGWLGDLASLAVLGPSAMALSVWGTRYLSRDLRETVDGLFLKFYRRVRPDGAGS